MPRKTIADVARVAGVSKSTVSRVLGGKTRYMRAETRERVLQAINTLGYRPSVVARSLVSKRTQTVGLLISDIGNPFYHEVIRGVEDVAVAHDYSIFFCNTNYDPARSRQHFHSLVDKQVDGVLFMASGDYSSWTLDEAAQHALPLVLVDWNVEDAPPQSLLSKITLNFVPGIHEAIAHLVSLGHTRIAHVSGPHKLATARKRKQAFLDAMEKHGLDAAQAPVIEGDLRVAGGRQALGAILEIAPRPTAVLAANDLTALGLLWEARNRDISVPEQLSIVGLDDITLASQVTPALTTVSLPRYDLGKIAMQLLLEMLQSGECFTRRVDTRLVIRQSTAPSPA